MCLGLAWCRERCAGAARLFPRRGFAACRGGIPRTARRSPVQTTSCANGRSSDCSLLNAPRSQCSARPWPRPARSACAVTKLCRAERDRPMRSSSSRSPSLSVRARSGGRPIRDMIRSVHRRIINEAPSSSKPETKQPRVTVEHGISIAPGCPRASPASRLTSISWTCRVRNVLRLLIWLIPPATLARIYFCARNATEFLPIKNAEVLSSCTT